MVDFDDDLDPEDEDVLSVSGDSDPYAEDLEDLIGEGYDPPSDDDADEDDEDDEGDDANEGDPTPVPTPDIAPSIPAPITPDSTPAADIRRTNYERSINSRAIAFAAEAKVIFETEVSKGNTVEIVVHEADTADA